MQLPLKYLATKYTSIIKCLLFLQTLTSPLKLFPWNIQNRQLKMHCPTKSLSLREVAEAFHCSSTVEISCLELSPLRLLIIVFTQLRNLKWTSQSTFKKN